MVRVKSKNNKPEKKKSIIVGLFGQRNRQEGVDLLPLENTKRLDISCRGW